MSAVVYSIEVFIEPTCMKKCDAETYSLLESLIEKESNDIKDLSAILDKDLLPTIDESFISDEYSNLNIKEICFANGGVESIKIFIESQSEYSIKAIANRFVEALEGKGLGSIYFSTDYSFK